MHLGPTATFQRPAYLAASHRSAAGGATTFCWMLAYVCPASRQVRMYSGVMDGYAAHVSVEVHRSPGLPNARPSESMIGNTCAADADGGLFEYLELQSRSCFDLASTKSQRHGPYPSGRIVGRSNR